MKTIPTYNNKNYASDANLLKRKRFASYFKPKFDLVKTMLGLLKLKGEETILDVGCGNGDALIEIRKKYHHNGKLQGVDIASGILKKARLANKLASANIRFNLGDARSLKFADNSFDAIILKHVLHNVDYPQKVLTECCRVLKPSGKLVIILTGKKTRLILKKIKLHIATLLNLKFYPEAESTINLENIKQFLDKNIWHYKIVRLRNRLELKNPKPYLDYIDSGRDFWGQINDKAWQKAMDFSKFYLNLILKNKKVIKDRSTLGIIIATKK